MKHLLLIPLLFSTAMTFGQNLTVNETDEFTGNEKRMTSYYEIGVAQVTSSMSYKLACATIRIDDAYAIDLWSSGDQGCAGAIGNYVIFLFDGGATLKLDDDLVDVECEERASSRYVIEPSEFEGKTLKRIRFAQSEGYIDYDFKGEFTMNQLIEAVKN